MVTVMKNINNDNINHLTYFRIVIVATYIKKKQAGSILSFLFIIILLILVPQTLFVQALQLKEGVRRPGIASGSIDPEVVQAIHRLTHAMDDFDKMGISRRAFSR